jgi:putative membrane protein
VTRVESFFSRADLEEIEAAVREAEGMTAGEIVPFVVSHSDHYEAAPWKGATLGAFLAVAAAAAAYQAGGFWGDFLLAWILLPALVGGAVGFAAVALVRPLRLWLAGAATVDRRVHQRATAAFVENEVFRTKERTGILIFLSLFERRVVVLGDSGINARVQQREWDAIVATIVEGIRSGRPGAALASAIRRCGELLTRRGVAIRPDDTDELPDQLRMREE